MKVALAYITVIIIWSTTPLAIKWSNGDIGSIAAVSIRMALASALVLMVLAVIRHPLELSRNACKVYLAASLGLFPAMPLVYWAAQHISSGMIALIFSMTPIATGLVSILILRQNPFTKIKLLALALAISGLVVVFGDQVKLNDRAGWAIGAALSACTLMGGSSVWLKSLNVSLSSLQQTTGALLFSLPSLLLCWYFWGDPWPAQVAARSIWSIVYLAVFGSLLGFTFYYYLLANMSPTSLSLVTLITPVSALYIGHFVDAEVVSPNTLSGAALIVVALAIYQGLSLKKVIGCFSPRVSEDGPRP